MELTDAQKADAARWEASCKVFAALPGADGLIAKYGRVPTFHDGEVDSVHLTKNGVSKIVVVINWPDIFGTDKIVVTITANQVIDIALEGYSPQNVIQELWVRVPSSQPGYEALPGDVELEMEPIYGVGGTLRLRDAKVSWAMQRP